MGGYIYHVINRSNERKQIFFSEGDYKAFERVLWQAADRFEVNVLSYCIMPNHWHMVLQPLKDGELSRFMGWLTLTHTQRWRAYRKSIGSGHLYQGRFKSFVVESNAYFLSLCRYVERNPLRAGLVEQAEAWRWSSLWLRVSEISQGRLAQWPVARPDHWLSLVNGFDERHDSDTALTQIRNCVNRGRPFGSDSWVEHTSAMLGLQSTIRSRGRPRNKKGS